MTKSEFLFIGAKLDLFLKSFDYLAALIYSFSSSRVLNPVAKNKIKSVNTPIPKKIFIPLISI